jgi:hypothetical protein
MCLIKECDELPVQDWLFCAAHLREYSLGPVKETVAEVLTEEDISERYAAMAQEHVQDVTSGRLPPEDVVSNIAEDLRRAERRGREQVMTLVRAKET